MVTNVAEPEDMDVDSDDTMIYDPPPPAPANVTPLKKKLGIRKKKPVAKFRNTDNWVESP